MLGKILFVFATYKKLKTTFRNISLSLPHFEVSPTTVFPNQKLITIHNKKNAMKADEEQLLGGDDQQSMMPPDLSFERLKVVSALGRGAKGVVFLVDHESELLALKVVSKDLIEKKKKKIAGDGDGDEYRRVCFEQRVLCRLRHPLLPRLRGVLADADRLVGYAIDYCPGRDLNVLRKNQTERMFSDDVIRYVLYLYIYLEYCLFDR